MLSITCDLTFFFFFRNRPAVEEESNSANSDPEAKVKSYILTSVSNLRMKYITSTFPSCLNILKEFLKLSIISDKLNLFCFYFFNVVQAIGSCVS